MHHSLQVRLLTIFGTLAIIPLVLVGALLSWQSYNIRRQEALNLQHEVMQRAATEITGFLESAEREMHLAVQVSGFQNGDLRQKQTVLSTLISYRGAFDELDLLDSNGQEQLRVSRFELLTAHDLRDRSQTVEFLTPQQISQTYYGPVRFNPGNGEPSMLIAIPVVQLANEAISGVLVGEVRLKPIWDLVATIRVGSTGFVSILDVDGRVVAHPDPSVVLGHTQFTPPSEDGVAIGLSGAEAIVTTSKLKIGNQELRLIAELPTGEALAPALRSLVTTSILILVMLVVASVLGIFAVRSIVRPVQALAEAAQAISEGDLSRQVAVMQQDEIGCLGQAFNTMTTQLRQTLEGLEQRVAERTGELRHALAEVEARAREQERLLEENEQQRETIREMSVPVLPVADATLVMPLVGALDAERLRLVQDQALRAIERARARMLILDITGVLVVDNQVAHGIIMVVQAARLLGTEVLLVGVRPEVAQAIVGLGLNLPELRTHNDLQGALNH